MRAKYFFEYLNLFLIVGLLILAFESLSQAQGVSQVLVKEDVVINTDQITLGDLVNIPDPYAAYILDEAPSDGQVVHWTREDFIRKFRVYSDKITDFQIVIPKKIKIERSTRAYVASSLKIKILEQLQNAGMGKTGTSELLDVDLRGLPVAQANDKFKVIPFKVRPKGAFQAEVIVESQGQPLRHFWVPGHVKYSGKVAILKSDKGPREKVSAEDVGWIEKDLTYSAEQMADESELSMKVTRQAIRAGTVLTSNLLDRELAVKFGEQVDVRVGQEILSISMKGIAQQNGYVGDIVKVRSTGNQKTITGRLVSRGLVQVEL